MSRSHPVDVHVGARLRQRRSLLGITRGRLADAVGLRFAQIQRYEEGSNRVSSSRLFEFATLLGVSVSHFFDELPANASTGRRMPNHAKKGRSPIGAPSSREQSLLNKLETFKLVRAYYKIRKTALRKSILEAVEAISAASDARKKRRRARRRSEQSYPSNPISRARSRMR